MFVIVPLVLLHWLCHSHIPQLNLHTLRETYKAKAIKTIYFRVFCCVATLLEMSYFCPDAWNAWHTYIQQVKLASMNHCLLLSNQWADLAQHVGSYQVVLILQDAYRRDGWLLMEAAGLPALIPATTLPQVDAEDLPWSASIKQHRNLEIWEGFYHLHLSFLSYTCPVSYLQRNP